MKIFSPHQAATSALAAVKFYPCLISVLYLLTMELPQKSFHTIL